MKLSLASAFILLASTAVAAPGKITTTKKPTPPKTTSTTSTTTPAAPSLAPAAPWHSVQDWCPAISGGKLTCQITQADPAALNAQPASLQTVFYAKGEINQWWGALGKMWACSNTQANTWQTQYCRMGPKGIGGVKISTYTSDVGSPISCYDVQQGLECMSTNTSGCNPSGGWVLGAWDASSNGVTRMVKIEKPTEADRKDCQPCPLWGDQQCA